MKGEESTNNRKMRRRATAEPGMGLRQRGGLEDRGEGGGAAPRHRGGKNNKEGAKRREAKQWGKESDEEYPSG